MSTTATETVRDIVSDALLDLGVSVIGQTPIAENMALGVRHLSRIMKTWNAKGYSQFLKASQTVTLTTGASYILAPVRPIKILDARFNRNGIETPMIEITRNEYDELPLKDTTGQPTQFYYDRQKEAAIFYVWPLLNVAAGETIEMTYEREPEDISSPNDAIDLPAEWYDAAVLTLAARLTVPFEIGEPKRSSIKMDAREALDEALASDVEGVVIWQGRNA